MIEKITAYKTSNGDIFEDETKAQMQETQIAIQEEIENFIQKYFCTGMGIWDISKTILENRKELLNILSKE